MPTSVEDVLKQALTMSESDRAILAERLISSLDPQVDPEADAAWQAEIARRAAEIDSGQVALEPWESVRDRLSKQTREPR